MRRRLQRRCTSRATTRSNRDRISSPLSSAANLHVGLRLRGTPVSRARASAAAGNASAIWSVAFLHSLACLGRCSSSWGVTMGVTMKLPRRVFLHLAAGAAAFPLATRFAKAQAYPTRPVHIVVGFSAGGPTDILARLIGQWLSERLGQPFVIEDRPGAATNIATEEVARAPPDGYTLLAAVSTNTINPALYPNLNFNFIHDIAMI